MENSVPRMHDLSNHDYCRVCNKTILTDADAMTVCPGPRKEHTASYVEINMIGQPLTVRILKGYE